MIDFCAICNPDPNDPTPALFQRVCDPCRANVVLPSEDDLRRASEQGERDRAAVVAAEGSWVDSGMRFR